MQIRAEPSQGAGSAEQKAKMALQRRSTMLGVMLISAALLQTALAAEYVVGEEKGWTFGASKFYDDWAASKDIRVGDTLNFNWEDIHDVVQMSPEDTEACNLGGNKLNRWTASGASVPLTEAGTFGFICSIGTHCSAGFMKMTVTVKAADTPGASPAPPATTTPSSPAPSAASSMLEFGQPRLVAALALFAASVALHVC